MVDLKDTIKLVIKGKEYVVKFPSIGQIRDIESKKAILSNGVYGSMVRSLTPQSEHALNIIDIEANFSVLIPKLSEDMKCAYSELGFKDYLELKKAYVDQFLPWYKGWFDLFNENVEK